MRGEAKLGEAVNHLEPPAVHEQVRDERCERRERDLALRDLVRELSPVEGIAIVKSGDRAWLPDQSEDVDPHEDVRRDEQAVDDRRLRRGVLIAKRDHARSSVATTFDPWIVKIVREPSEM